MSAPFDPYYQWLGIPPEEQPANHYQLLGIKWFEDNIDVISAAVDRQMLHLRTYQIGEYSDFSQRLMNEVVSAKLCLLDPQRKATYDQKLLEGDLAASIEAQKAAGSPAFGPRLEALFDEADQAQPEGLLHKPRRKLWKPSGRHVKLLVSLGGGLLFVLLLVTMASWLVGNVRSRLNGGEKQAPVEVLPHAEDPIAAKIPVEPVGQTPPTPKPLSPPAQPTQPAADPGQVDPQEAQPLKPDPTQPTQSPNGGAESTQPAPTQPTPTQPTPDAGAGAKAAPQASDRRIAVPAEDARQKARLLVEERHQISLAQGPLAKVRRAKQLLQVASGRSVAADAPVDVAVQYEMLETASRLAAEGGDLKLSLKTIDIIGVRYEIDPMAAKLSRLIEAVAMAKNAPVRIRQTVGVASDLVDQAVEQKQFDMAQRIIDVALRLCQRPAGREFRKGFVNRRKNIRKQHEQSSKIQTAQKTLQTAPDDPQANLLVGGHLCFDKQDWPAGLPLLAKGSDKGLAKLARRELENPPQNTDEEIRLADAWWLLSAVKFGPQKRPLLLRAARWYRQAQPKLTVGPQTKHVDKRLETIARLTEPKPE